MDDDKTRKDASVQTKNALLAFEKGDYDVAHHIASLCLLSDDDHDEHKADAVLLRGLCRFRQHDPEGSISDALNFLGVCNGRSRPKSVSIAHFLAGSGYEASGNIESAIHHFELAFQSGTEQEDIRRPVDKLLVITMDTLKSRLRKLRCTKIEKPMPFNDFIHPIFKKRLYRIQVLEIHCIPIITGVQVHVRCGIVDEMSLFRENEMETTSPLRVMSNGRELPLSPLPELMGGNHNGNLTFRNGKSGFSTVLSDLKTEYLDIEVDGVMGVRVGLISRILITGTFQTFRIIDDVLCKEEWDASIAGKIWDSAIYLSRLSRQVFEQHRNGKVLRGLDLGSGTGIVGIYASIGIKDREIYLTDIESALNLMRANVKVNETNANVPGRVRVQLLEWGNKDHIQQVLNEGELDFIFASDVVYETAFLGALLDTLDQLASVRTTLYLAYKQRGLSSDERSGFFQVLSERFKVVKKLDVNELERIDAFLASANDYGIEIWKACKTIDI